MSSPTPIAFCITDLDPGGAEKALLQIVTRLDRTRWSPVVYCLGPRGELADVLETAGIETHCLNAGRRDFSVILRLARLLKQQRPAILQTFLFHANFAGRIAARIAKVPVVVSGIRVAEREKSWHLWLDWLTKRWVAHHVAVSQSVADFTSRKLRLANEQISVIPNGVEASHFANATPADLSSFGIPSTANTLLFVGRLHPQKGLFTLLSAMVSLGLTDERDLHLLVVGDGPQRVEAEAFVDSSLIEGRVHWLGSRNDVPALMKSATLLVLPSLWEGMPNVVLEAMAAGLPVVATNVDGTADLVSDGRTGWLCPPGSTDELEKSLKSALDSPADRTIRAAAAQALVTERLTWDVVAQSYEALWRRLLSPGR